MSSVATLSYATRRYIPLGSTLSIGAKPLSNYGSSATVYTVQAADNVTVTETVTNLLVHIASLSDNVTVSESVVALLSHFSSVSDNVTVSESVSNLLTATNTVSDSVTVSEENANLLSRFVSLSDSVTLTESVAAAFIIDIAVFDAVNLSESLNFTKAIGLLVFDTVTITDALTEPLTWTIEDEDTNPLENVKVWLSFGSPYTVHNLVRDSIKFTNSSGQVNYAIEWNVIYYGWRQLDGYGFTDPWVFRYNTTTMRWENYQNGAWSLWNP